MSKHRNNYIKYKRAELEDYIKHPESCVKKIRTVESLRFAPNVIGTFSDSIMRILSKKIGKFDVKLDGVVLDFRRTKLLNTSSLVRTDSTSMLINVEADFYVFSPRKDVIVNGIVKHINRQSMETIISVVIYRVFNVKIVFKGNIKQHDIKIDQEIQIRIKDFHFDNVIPYIEGEMVGTLPRRINFDDVVDSGISESDVTSPSNIIIKQEPMDIGNEEPINFESNTRKRKRKDLDTSTIIQPAKKIKQERIEEEITKVPDISEVRIKQERISDDELLNHSLTNKKLDRVSNQVPTGSSDETPEKKKKKKKDKKNKKDKSNVDDFESSLMELFSTPKVKQEK